MVSYAYSILLQDVMLFLNFTLPLLLALWYLDLWCKEEFMALFNEGLIIQNHDHFFYSHCDDQHCSGRFADLLM